MATTSRIVFLLSVHLVLGCYDAGSDGKKILISDQDSTTAKEDDTATDTDTDTDGDGDSDTDTDTDTDSDTDTDTDSDTDTDADSDSAIGADSEVDGDAGDADTDTDTDGDTDGDAGVGPDTDLDGGAGTGEDWDMYLTVDNQFDVYFGTPFRTTDSVVGGGDDWQVEYHFTADGRTATDFLYVATASDQWYAQGFIGTFTNLTRNKVTNTGDDVWQVFAAGAYPESNPYWPDPWPESQMPTQEQVDTAIAFAQANDLWVTPVGGDGYDNDPTTPTDPYEFPWNATYPNIPTSAKWIWYEKDGAPDGNLPSPLYSYNHDEFLVFRVAGQVAIIII